MKAILSEKGQVTIPKTLRQSLGLKAGCELEFEERGGALVAMPVVKKDPLTELVGLISRTDVDKALVRLRGPAWSPRLDRRRK